MSGGNVRRLSAFLGYLALVGAVVLLRLGDPTAAVAIVLTSAAALIAARIGGSIVLAAVVLAAVVLVILNRGVDDDLGRRYDFAFLFVGVLANLAAALVGLGWRLFAWTSDRKGRRLARNAT
jgi:hypothetical protein